MVLRSGIPPRCIQNIGARGPGPMSSVRGNPVIICVYYGQKGRFFRSDPPLAASWSPIYFLFTSESHMFVVFLVFSWSLNRRQAAAIWGGEIIS